MEKKYEPGNYMSKIEMEQTKFIMRSDEPKRDWEEDFNHENGNYMCICYKCKNTFFGHKRRVECKLCSDSQAAGIFPIHTGQQSNTNTMNLCENQNNSKIKTFNAFQDEYQKGLDW